MKNASRRGVILSCLVLMLAACGLIVSDEQRIARAAEQIETGDYRAAMIELKNILAGSPDNADARLMLAEVSLGLGDALAAEKEVARAAESGAPEFDLLPMFLKVLVAKRDFAEVLAVLATGPSGLSKEQQWSFRGSSLLGLGKAEGAAQTYRDWLADDDSSSEASVGFANAVAMSGDLDEADRILSRVIEQHPTDYKVWHSKAVVQSRLGDFGAAKELFLRAAELIRPQTDIRRYASIITGLTESNLALGENDAVRENLDGLMRIAPNSATVLFLAARLARADGDIVLASRYLQEILNISPDNSEAQLILANMQMMQGNYAQAENLLNRMVVVSPEHLRARKLLAQVQLRRSQPADAIEALGPLLEVDSGDSDLYTILGQASIQQGFSDEAIEQFRKAAELSPHDVEARLNLASAYFFADEPESVIEVLRQVQPGDGANFRRERLLMMSHAATGRDAEADSIANSLLGTDSDPELATVVVADHYLRTDRANLARNVLHKFVATHPETARAKAALGRVELIAGNQDIARGLFSSVLELEKENLAALMGLARIFELSADDEKMVALLKEAAGYHTNARGPRVMLAHRLLKDGKAHEAEPLANELVAIGFADAHIAEVVAGVFVEVGRAGDALVYYQRAAKLDPDSAAIQTALSRTYLALGRTVDARQALDRALRVSPGWPPATTMLALIEMRQGRIDEALQLVDEFQALHPEEPAAFVLEGEIQFYRRDFAAAATAFKKGVSKGAGRAAVLREYQARVKGDLAQPERALQSWLKSNSRDYLTRRFLAQHYQTNNRGTEAIQEFEILIALDPNDTIVLNNLAWQYQQNNDLQRAVDTAERAYALDREDGSIADTLGWIYYDLDRLDNSVELLSDASRLSPDNGEIQFHYAVALSDSDDHEKARQILQELMDNNVQFPSRSRAEEMLRKL